MADESLAWPTWKGGLVTTRSRSASGQPDSPSASSTWAVTPLASAVRAVAATAARELSLARSSRSGRSRPRVAVMVPLPQPRSSTRAPSGRSRARLGRWSSSRRVPGSGLVPAKVLPWAQSSSPRASLRWERGQPLDRVGDPRGLDAWSTRDFWRPRLARTEPKCTASTSFIVRLRNFSRPVASTSTESSACWATRPAYSSRPPSDLGSAIQTRSAPRTASASSPKGSPAARGVGSAVTSSQQKTSSAYSPATSRKPGRSMTANRRARPGWTSADSASSSDSVGSTRRFSPIPPPALCAVCRGR